MGLHPIITHPSRLITKAATLINSISANVTKGTVTRGLIMNDVSDHLPVFAAFEMKIEKI